ncbi:hypothetical protein pipiens_017842 [Culex pipiens pipiens]|uniref:Endonuclease/exonuclease/phosphatase domain-containing protein n=1 Tax=Culex pipiens pipiens TaxID=38569 RepID=A0ABD1CEX1_CULPP
MGGGTAVLVRRELAPQCSFRRVSDNICVLRVSVFGENLCVFSVYARSSSDQADPEFTNLSSYLYSMPVGQRSNVLIMGDLNAHVGKLDLLPYERELIGNRLHHAYSKIVAYLSPGVEEIAAHSSTT